MITITDNLIDSAIEHIEELSDSEYEKLMSEFEENQKVLWEYLDDVLENFNEEEEQEDIISIVLTIYVLLRDNGEELVPVNPKIHQMNREKEEELLEEVKEIQKSSELIGEEDLQTFYIDNKALHDFVLGSLEPGDESPFNAESADHAYSIIKTCYKSLINKR